MTRGCHVRFREQPGGGGNSLRLTRLAVSDSGGEHAAVLYSMPSKQCGTRKMAALRH